MIDAAISCPSAYVVDGDSLRGGPTHIRLLGIDAPELGRGPSWRSCEAGDGKASRQSLQRTLKYGPVTYRVVTVNRFASALERTVECGCHVATV